MHTPVIAFGRLYRVIHGALHAESKVVVRLANTLVAPDILKCARPNNNSNRGSSAEWLVKDNWYVNCVH